MLRGGLKFLAIGLGSISLSFSVAAAPTKPSARLIAPSVQLWYEGTGRLSANILGLKDFVLWNIIMAIVYLRKQNGPAKRFSTGRC